MVTVGVDLHMTSAFSLTPPIAITVPLCGPEAARTDGAIVGAMLMIIAATRKANNFMIRPRRNLLRLAKSCSQALSAVYGFGGRTVCSQSVSRPTTSSVRGSLWSRTDLVRYRPRLLVGPDALERGVPQPVPQALAVFNLDHEGGPHPLGRHARQFSEMVP